MSSEKISEVGRASDNPKDLGISGEPPLSNLTISLAAAEKVPPGLGLGLGWQNLAKWGVGILAILIPLATICSSFCSSFTPSFVPQWEGWRKTPSEIARHFRYVPTNRRIHESVCALLSPAMSRTDLGRNTPSSL